MIGKSLGHFHVVGKLGEGGMGEVYLAEDTKLGRKVALKILPEEITRVPERRARFAREARAAAALSHPNLVTVHSVEEIDGRDVIVMEWIRGKTLAERIPQSGFDLATLLRYAIPLTEALGAAHGRGVIHRDLKPGNVMIDDDDRIRVLDFGLARFSDGAGADASTVAASASRRVTTEEGKILGTVAYMSPEQLEGKRIDHRTDIFSLGVVLYQMSTGRMPFQGDSRASVISSILRDDPPAVSRLNAELPRHLGRIIRLCLAKDPERRYQTALDVRNELALLKDETESGEGEIPVGPRTKRPMRRTALLVAAGIVLGAGLAWVWNARRSETIDPGAGRTEFTIDLPDEESIAWQRGNPLAASPDGRLIACVVRSAEGDRIHLQELSHTRRRVLPGTVNASSPFFSPDGEWLGFFASGELKRLRLADGMVQTVCEVAKPRGAAWRDDGTIVFTAGSRPAVHLVPAAGGLPRRIEIPKVAGAFVFPIWPVPVPGRNAVLTTLTSGILYEEPDLAYLDLASGTLRVLLEGAAWPALTAGGRLLFVKGGRLRMASFDSRSGTVGEEMLVLTELFEEEHFVEGPPFAVSPAGVLCWMEPDESFPLWQEQRSIVEVDTTGATRTLAIPPGPYTMPDLSPGEDRLALTVFREKSVENWIWEFDRSSFTRLSDGANDHIPVWSPSGDRVAISAAVDGPFDVFVMPAHPGGKRERLTRSPLHQDPASWSPDGRFLTVVTVAANSDFDIFRLDLESDAPPVPLIKTPAFDSHPMISPDGDWLLYTSSRTGQPEIYLQAFPEPASVIQVSDSGGLSPRWSVDGRRIYYWIPSSESETPDDRDLHTGGEFRHRQTMRAVDFSEMEGSPRVSPSRPLFASRWIPHASGRPNYEVTKADRFLVLQSDPTTLRTIRVVTHWNEGPDPL